MRPILREIERPELLASRVMALRNFAQGAATSGAKLRPNPWVIRVSAGPA